MSPVSRRALAVALDEVTHEHHLACATGQLSPAYDQAVDGYLDMLAITPRMVLVGHYLALAVDVARYGNP